MTVHQLPVRHLEVRTLASRLTALIDVMDDDQTRGTLTQALPVLAAALRKMSLSELDQMKRQAPELLDLMTDARKIVDGEVSK